MAKEQGLTARSLHGAVLQLGGEQRFGQVQLAEAQLELPSGDVKGHRIKWFLLTPAIFMHGWLPGWIGAQGQVNLRELPPRTDARRERRRARREEGWHYDETRDNAPPIHARLVAASIGKPQAVGGWELLGETGEAENGAGRAKSTFLAVPAGSVFYFEGTGANPEQEAATLARVLNSRCRSDFYGEKGFGLGVCGTWNFYPGH
jgi:hypothetical protein